MRGSNSYLKEMWLNIRANNWFLNIVFKVARRFSNCWLVELMAVRSLGLPPPPFRGWGGDTRGRGVAREGTEGAVCLGHLIKEFHSRLPQASTRLCTPLHGGSPCCAQGQDCGLGERRISMFRPANRPSRLMTGWWASVTRWHTTRVWGSICCADKFEGIYNSVVVPDI